MERMQLGLDSLGDFDFGKVDIAFKKELAAVVRDCLDRPGEKGARKVNLTVEVIPDQLQDGDVVDCVVRFLISNSTPKRATAARPLVADKAGRLFFQPDAMDNPHQTTFTQPADPDEDD